MRFSVIFLVALRALRRNTMRSILTALGIKLAAELPLDASGVPVPKN